MAGEPGKLLLVSDLEGCSPQSASKQPQSQLLCTPEFFKAVTTFLESNPKNKVAFLGDYFDQGPYVVESINGIVELHKTFGPRVHILLGNRDLNKLRFIYEMHEAPQTLGEKKWPVWAKFYAELTPQLSLMDRLKHILNNSMGAGGPLNLVPADELNQEEAAYLLVRAFSEPAANLFPFAAAAKAKIESNIKFTDFITNVRVLFTAGKIVTHDTDFKILMSHAGGAEPFLLHNSEYYTDIKTKITPVGASGLTYYEKIETVRLLLQEAPVAAYQATTFDESTYNSPLDCIPTLFDDANPEPVGDYYLLQGLGLKPNGGKHFTSFVQSCDIQGCKGPYGADLPLDPPLTYEAYLDLLAKTGIQAIAFGHAPHCVPIPVIYKRPESPILFIGNDTSNGYRPSAISAIEQIPLSYVSTNEAGALIAGVFSLPGSTEHTYNGGSMFSPMIGVWSAESAPKFLMDPPRIQYTGKALTFPARVEKTPPGIFKPAEMAGGRRRRTVRKSNNRRARTAKKVL